MTDYVTPKDLDAIEAYCEAATPEPWEWDYKDEGYIRSADGVPVCYFGHDADYYPTEGEPPSEEDRKFMLHSRTDLPRLVKACRSALKRIEELETASLDGFK